MYAYSFGFKSSVYALIKFWYDFEKKATNNIWFTFFNRRCLGNLSTKLRFSRYFPCKNSSSFILNPIGFSTMMQTQLDCDCTKKLQSKYPFRKLVTWQISTGCHSELWRLIFSWISTACFYISFGKLPFTSPLVTKTLCPIDGVNGIKLKCKQQTK